MTTTTALPRDLIRRRMTALLAAVALAVTGLFSAAAPARAQSNEDIVRFLLGAAAIAIIVRAIDENRRPTYIDRHTLPDACLETVRMQGRTADVYHAGCLRRAGYHNLPGQCEVNFRTSQGRRTGYEARCLYRAGYRAEGHSTQPVYPRLPRGCEITYRYGHDRLLGYSAQCLRQSGIRNLPGHCVVTARNGQRIYNAQCLWDAGWRRGR